MKKIVINSFANDEPGIVSKISGIISSYNGNIIKSKMMRIDNIFSAIIIVNIHPNNEKLLIKKIKQISELNSIIKDIDVDENNKINYTIYSFSLECIDNEGIIHHFTKYLNNQKINIEKMNTSTLNAPITGITLFKLDSLLCVPSDLNIKDIKKELNKLSEQFNVSYNISLFKSK